MGFKGGHIDPCLLTKKSKLGICYTAIHVDDNLIVGHMRAVEDIIQQIRKHKLVLNVENGLRDYSACDIILSDDHLRGWLG